MRSRGFRAASTTNFVPCDGIGRPPLFMMNIGPFATPSSD